MEAFASHKRDIVSALRAEGVEIEETNADHFPAQVSEKGFEALPEKARAHIQPLADACRNYYAGILMHDRFGADHEARRAWRENMITKYGSGFKDLVERNKFRINVFTRISSGLNLLVRLLDEHNVHTQEAEMVRLLQREFPNLNEKPFPFLSEEERREIVLKIDNIARSFLEITTRVDKA